MYTYIWKFHVKQQCKYEFEHLYGLKGAWVKLFSQSPMYLKTELISNLNESYQYLTIDYWMSKESYQLFRFENKNDFDLIDAKGEYLTEKEEFLGEFLLK